MSKRINIMLPDSTVAVLDKIVSKGNRSRFIDKAVLRLIQTESAASLRERLKVGALANARLDLEVAQEWFPAEQELWQRLDQEEQAAKPSRKGVKSTSRRSTRP